MMIVNKYVHEDSCIQEVEHTTEKLVTGMLKRNPHLATLTKAKSLDPTRAKQASKKN
jgi:hypothetical protein